MKILSYAKENISSFEKGGVSSNEIRFFEYEGKKYILKTPLMASQDMGACMQNMLLEATNLKIGSCWIGTYPDPIRMGHLSTVLNIPADIEPFCGLALGYPVDKEIFKEVERKATIHYNRYNA